MRCLLRSLLLSFDGLQFGYLQEQVLFYPSVAPSSFWGPAWYGREGKLEVHSSYGGGKGTKAKPKADPTPLKHLVLNEYVPKAGGARRGAASP